jgi:hypothetical protein
MLAYITCVATGTVAPEQSMRYTCALRAAPNVANIKRRPRDHRFRRLDVYGFSVQTDCVVKHKTIHSVVTRHQRLLCDACEKSLRTASLHTLCGMQEQILLSDPFFLLVEL